MKLVLMHPIYEGNSNHLKAKEAELYYHRPLNLFLAKFPLIFKLAVLSALETCELMKGGV